MSQFVEIHDEGNMNFMKISDSNEDKDNGRADENTYRTLT